MRGETAKPKSLFSDADTTPLYKPVRLPSRIARRDGGFKFRE